MSVSISGPRARVLCQYRLHTPLRTADLSLQSVSTLRPSLGPTSVTSSASCVVGKFEGCHGVHIKDTNQNSDQGEHEAESLRFSPAGVLSALPSSPALWV